jgi:capsular polysaccharide biosynthesis protein
MGLSHVCPIKYQPIIKSKVPKFDGSAEIPVPADLTRQTVNGNDTRLVPIYQAALKPMAAAATATTMVRNSQLEPRSSPVARFRSLPYTRRDPQPPHQPRTTVQKGRLGAVAFGHFGGVGLDLMLAFLDHTISRTWAAAALPSVIGGRR